LHFFFPLYLGSNPLPLPPVATDFGRFLDRSSRLLHWRHPDPLRVFDERPFFALATVRHFSFPSLPRIRSPYWCFGFLPLATTLVILPSPLPPPLEQEQSFKFFELFSANLLQSHRTFLSFRLAAAVCAPPSYSSWTSSGPFPARLTLRHPLSPMKSPQFL